MRRPNRRLVDTVPPIMQATARELRRLRDLETTRNPQLEYVLLNDPAAAIAVFRALGQLRPDAYETVNDAAHAISLIGQESLQGLVGRLPALTPGSGNQRPEGTAAQAYSQAAHAGSYANGLAEKAGLHKSRAIPTAALLQNPAVLALWTSEPDAASRATSAARNGEPFDQAFSAELGEPLAEANNRLAEAWSLPLLARQAMADCDDFNPRPRLVRLADDLAQSTALDLRRQANPAITAVLADFLNCEDAPAVAWLHRQTVDAARTLHGFGYPLPGFELLYIDAAEDPHGRDEQPPDSVDWRDRGGTPMPALPPPAPAPPFDLRGTLAAVMHQIRREAGASRVMFATADRTQTRMQTRLALGGRRDDTLHRFDVDLAERHLFSMLMQRPQSVWLNRDNAKRYQAYLPAELRRVFGPDGAYLMSLFVGEEPLGLLYADGRGLSAAGYESFRRLGRGVAEGLTERAGLH